MSAAPPQNVVAFQVFIWNKRRYAIPVNAQGEHLGPAMPFRNPNRNRRNGYGPGSDNTGVLEDSSSPLQSPTDPPVDTGATVAAAAAAVRSAPQPNFPDASFDSGCSDSSLGRSSRQRLSRTVSFIENIPTATPTATPTTATTTAASTSAGLDGAAATLVLSPAPMDLIPPSILRKKSSFRVTLRPLFDFDFEPPHTPPALKSRRSSTREKEAKATGREEALCGLKTKSPSAGASSSIATTSAAAALSASPMHQHPADSLPPITALGTAHTRPHTPPLGAPHSQSDLASRFQRTNGHQHHHHPSAGRHSAVSAGGAQAGPLISLEADHRPLSDSSPPQLSAAASPSSPSPTKGKRVANAEGSSAAAPALSCPPAVAVTAAPSIATTPTAAAAAAAATSSTVTPPSPQRSPSPSKGAVALAHTTVRSPPPDDLFFILQMRVSPATPQGETSVVEAAKETTTGDSGAAGGPSPTLSPSLSLSASPVVQREGSTAATVEREESKEGRETGKSRTHKSPRRSRSKEKKEVVRGRSATAALSKDVRPKGGESTTSHIDKKHRNVKSKTERKESDDSLQRKSSTPVHPPLLQPKMTRAEESTALEAGEVGDDESFAPKYSDFLPPKKPSVAADSTATTSASPTNTTSSSGGATTTDSSASARTSSASNTVRTAAHFRCVSPVSRYSPELNGLRVSSALGVYVDDRQQAAASPSAQSNADVYDLFRYGSPQPSTPTKATLPADAATPPLSTSAAPQALSTPPRKEKQGDAPAATTATSTAAATGDVIAASASSSSTTTTIVSGPLQPGGSATNYDFHCSLVAHPVAPTKPASPRSNAPAPLRRHTVTGDAPKKPHIAPLLTTATAFPSSKGNSAQQEGGEQKSSRVVLPPLSPHGASGTSEAGSPQARRHTAPQALPAPHLSTSAKQQQRKSAPAVMMGASSTSPPCGFSFDSGEGSLLSASPDASAVSQSRSTMGMKSDDSPDSDDGENNDGADDDDRSSATSFFDVHSDGGDTRREWESGGSYASDSRSPTNDSKTTGSTTTTSTTTTSSTTTISKGLESHHGSIWSTMMHRLRQPLITRSTAGEDPLLYQLNRYRNRRALERSRVYYGSRVETVRAAGRRLSSTEMAGPTDPLQHRRRLKKGPLSEPASPRQRWD